MSKHHKKVAVGLFLIIFFIGSGIKSFSLMFTSLEERGFSMGFIGLGALLAMVVAMVSGMTLGKLCDVLKVKTIIGIGAVCSCIGFIIVAFTYSEAVMLIALVIVGFAMTAGGYAPATIILTNWFKSKFAFMVSLVSTGMSLGTSFISLLYAFLYAELGFTNTLLILASLQIIVPFIALKFLIVEKPEFVSQTKYYDENEVIIKAKSTGIDCTTKKAFKLPVTWFVFIVFFLIVGLISIVQTYIPTQVEVNGSTKKVASLLFSIMMIFGATATILGGLLSQKKSPMLFLVISTGCFIVAMILLLSKTKQVYLLVIMAILFGISYPSTTTAGSLILKEVFADNTYKKLIGMFHAVGFFGIGVFNPIVGSIYDKAGTFQGVFSVMFIMFIITFVAIMFYPLIKRKSEKIILKERKNEEK